MLDYEHKGVTLNQPVFESINELSATIRLSRAKTYEALRSGIIPSIRIGKRFIVPREAVRKWLESCGEPKVAAA